MSTKLIKIIGYVAGLGTLVTGTVINQILSAFYVPQPYITVTISVFGGVVTLATLIYSSIKNAPPDGTEPVYAPTGVSPTVGILTSKGSAASAPVNLVDPPK